MVIGLLASVNICNSMISNTVRDVIRQHVTRDTCKIL